MERTKSLQTVKDTEAISSNQPECCTNQRRTGASLKKSRGDLVTGGRGWWRFEGSICLPIHCDWIGEEEEELGMPVGA
jgi:hypothetical protein